MKFKNLYILFIFALSFSACTNSPQTTKTITKKQLCKKDNVIYIIKHDWHVGLIIESKKLNKIIPQLKQRFPNSKYYEIGWGDNDFYQANEINTGLTLQALFWPTNSVLHIVGLEDTPLEVFTNNKITTLYSDNENYKNLLEFIKSSFKVEVNKQIISKKN